MTVADLYSAFTSDPRGGSHAWIVPDAADLSAAAMQSIAHDLAAPATGFVTGVDGASVSVRFFSTTTEYGMCGHGSVALFTQLVDRGRLDPGQAADFTLITPTADTAVKVDHPGETLRVMLDLQIADFDSTELTASDMAPMFGLDSSGIDAGMPIAVSRSDFVHLIVPIADVDQMAEMTPDFDALAGLHESHGIETIAAVCPTPDSPTADVRVRDFCPAVGTDEAAATGTTNRVVSLYLARHGLVPGGTRQVAVRAEQGIEMGRPSMIESRLNIVDGAVDAVSVGGSAVRVETRTIPTR